MDTGQREEVKGGGGGGVGITDTKKDSMSVGNGPIRTGAHRYRVSFPIKVRTGPSIVVHNPTHWPTHWSPRYRDDDVVYWYLIQ